MTDPSTRAQAAPPGTLREVARLFLRLGLTAFGGPAAHIAMFRHEVVVIRGWLTEQRFLDLLGAANLLPGPTSTEVAIGIGHERAGWRGMLVSGVLFILPASLMVLALAIAYERAGSIPEVRWLLYGIQPVVIAVVAQALLLLAPAALRTLPAALVGAGALALALVRVDPLAIVLAGAVAGLLVSGLSARLGQLALLVAVRPLDDVATPAAAAGAHQIAAGPTVAIGTALAAGTATGVITLAGLFLTFLKMGLVVFGSGYVLLAFLRADFVEAGLLTDRQLLDAVAIGQVTPGPLFTTATFIGYLLAGLPGALVATLAVFLPSFVLVGLVHPIVPRLRASPTWSAMLDGVNAAALGLVAAVTFELGRAAIVDALTLALAAVSLAILIRWRPNPVWLLLAGAATGLVAHLAGAA